MSLKNQIVSDFANPVLPPAGAASSATGMLGQATSALRGPLQAHFQKWYGIADLHARQKWNLVWPQLAALPPGRLSVIDAGCGDGIWSFELAARRPEWRMQGIDLDAAKIAEAQQTGTRLGVPNVSFAVADFVEFAPAAPADLVLSIASAHYLAQTGRGIELLRYFHRWLKPGGTLILYGPRHLPESPLASWLPKLSGQWGFTRKQLEDWSAQAGFAVQSLDPAVGRLGTLAKQIAIRAGGSTPLRAAAYPVTIALDWLDRRGAGRDRASSAWCLVATRKAGGPLA